MEPIRATPNRIRLAPIFGSLSGAVVSGLAHGALLGIFAVVVVTSKTKEADLRIRVAQGAPEADFEEFAIEHVTLQTLPIERPEFQTPETVAGNESDLGDIGGALEAQVAEAISDVSAPGGLLNADLRRSLVAGLGGPGTGTGRASLRDGSFNSLIEYASEHGLDVVIVMDSTGSMRGEIEAVKRKIATIGGALLTKVPEARLSIVSYKDEGDEYVAKGLPLTRDLAEVQKFLVTIKAGGGGDTPEAVEAGLQWAISQNEFRQSARKVILLFGDQPPHEEDLPLCVSLATDFRTQRNGVVSTITCRRTVPITHYYQISRAGGGESFTLKNSRRIMEELLVLVFGDKHRKDVVEFFELDVLGE